MTDLEGGLSNNYDPRCNTPPEFGGAVPTARNALLGHVEIVEWRKNRVDLEIEMGPMTWPGRFLLSSTFISI